MHENEYKIHEIRNSVLVQKEKIQHQRELGLCWTLVDIHTECKNEVKHLVRILGTLTPVFTGMCTMHKNMFMSQDHSYSVAIEPYTDEAVEKLEQEVKDKQAEILMKLKEGNNKDENPN